MTTTIIQLISQPWHWSISGLMLVVVMFLLLWFGGEFGVSSNLRTLCTMSGAGKRHAFFNIDWRNQAWNLVFVTGAILGGYLAMTFLAAPEPVRISPATSSYLLELGINTPTTLAEGDGYVPRELFAGENLLSFGNLLLLIGGGLLIGFGARWAGGCTSGHAISGLANLQLPSLIAVIGFFIGGLVMVWGILPLLLGT